MMLLNPSDAQEKNTLNSKPSKPSFQLQETLRETLFLHPKLENLNPKPETPLYRILNAKPETQKYPKTQKPKNLKTP